MDELLLDEIRGHEIRTKGQPKYELNEPDISAYSGFEKRYQSRGVIYQLADENDKICAGGDSLLDITEKYYAKLFKKSRTCALRQDRLLKNIIAKVSTSDRATLRLLSISVRGKSTRCTTIGL